MIKLTLVWLLLLAVPFQGFASASMLSCAPSAGLTPSTMVLSSAGNESAMVTDDGAALSDHCRAMAAQHHDGSKSGVGHAAGNKCGSCAGCHVGAALASPDANRIAVETPQFSSIPFAPGFVAAVFLDRTERPPQKHFL